MKKFLILAILITLTGCSQNLGGGVVTKEFELAGERVLVGGEALLGGELTADFKPETKLEKWGDETYLKIWSEETGDKTASQVGDKVVWNADSGNEYRFYTKTAEELDNEDGGFEYEIIFKEKPKTNVVTLKIETKDLDFFYQPELTQEEIDEGAERPENIVGSYAVYHSTKSGDYSQMGGKNYKAGKAFHIYRPLIIDAKGAEVWGELNIKNGVLTVTIPQDFLDRAVYPVIVDPTFGYTSVGSNSVGFDNNNSTVIAYKYTTTEDGTVESMSLHGRHRDGGSNTTKGVFGLLNSDYDTIIDGYYSSEETWDGTLGWQTGEFSVGSRPMLSDNTVYYVAATLEVQPAISYDTGDTDYSLYEKLGTAYDSTMELPSSPTINNRQWSLYATYTASGGEATSTPSTSQDVFFFD